MRRRHLWIAGAALAAAVAIPAVVAAATTAYTSPTLKVTNAAGTTVIAASASVSDDATARASIYAPVGTTATLTATPGTQVGAVEAQVSALALGGALLPLTGVIIVAQPGQVPAASQQACIGTQTPAATLILSLSAAGQVINLPAYVVATSGSETALGPLKVVFCIAPPDLPPPVGATFGAKFLSATLTLRGVFTAPATGVWVAIWTPWQAGTGQVNAAATVASPAATAPGSLTLGAKRRAARVTVTGTVTQGGRPVAGVSVRLVRGKTAGRLGSFKTVRTNAQGKFSVTALAKAGTFFRASTTAAARANAALCGTLAASLPVPCVNGTISGFAATSKVVRAR
jgi:hypothetical protein